MPKTSSAPRSAFTLVELLVVIAIIGVLVALLLPAVQAAREAARRSECKNKLKQVGLSIQNFNDAKKCLPTGGDAIFPQIGNYVQGNAPLGPDKQGLGWGYQILPYLEQGPLSGITTQAQLQSSVVPIYVCPSRRSATTIQDVQTPLLQVTLSDYAGAMPCGYPTSDLNGRFAPLGQGPSPQPDSNALRRERLFGSSSSNATHILSVPDNETYMGAIVRTPTRSSCNRGVCTRTPAKNVPSPVELQQIEDGTSNTILVGEKFIRPDLYEGGSSSDDRGWSDGWDPDTMRSTCFPPLQDSLSGTTDNTLFGPSADVVNFGSAHPGGFNVCFVDGSVHTIRYEIDPYVFDNLGDRRDGEAVDLSAM